MSEIEKGCETEWSRKDYEAQLRTNHEKLTEEIYFELRWLTERPVKSVNYLIVILVSIISSALTAFLFTHW